MTQSAREPCCDVTVAAQLEKRAEAVWRQTKKACFSLGKCTLPVLDSDKTRA